MARNYPPRGPRHVSWARAHSMAHDDDTEDLCPEYWAFAPNFSANVTRQDNGRLKIESNLRAEKRLSNSRRSWFYPISDAVAVMEPPSEKPRKTSADAQREKEQRETPRHQFLQPDRLWQEVVMVFIICMAQIMAQAGWGQALPILHETGRSLGSTQAELAWYLSGYSLCSGTFILIMGRLGDLYGHKPMFISGMLWYGFWAMLSGVAVYSGQIMFDICRTLQGMGSAMMLPNAVALLARTYPPFSKQKGMVMSLFGACAPNGFLVGAIFSSIFATYETWPWTYWAATIACILMAIVIFLIIPDEPPAVLEESKTQKKLPKPPRKSLKEQLDNLDLLGCVTGVSGLVLINFAWNQGPVVGWHVPYNYVLLIVGFLSLAAFFYVELAIASKPLVPVKDLQFDSAYALACIAAGWSSFGIWVYYLWQLWEQIRGNSPLQGTGQMVPTGIFGAIASVTTGFIIARSNPGWIMMAAMVAFGIGNALLAGAPPHQSYWAQTFVSCIVAPFGMDMSFPSAIIILSDASPPGQQGMAASLVMTVQNYAIAIGLGIAATIEVNVNRGGKKEQDLLRGYRGAWYAAVGMDLLGVAVAGLYLLHRGMRAKKGKIEQRGVVINMEDRKSEVGKVMEPKQ